jgi:hypothetical protein
MLQKRTNVKMVFGRCADTLSQYELAPQAYHMMAISKLAKTVKLGFGKVPGTWLR